MTPVGPPRSTLRGSTASKKSYPAKQISKLQSDQMFPLKSARIPADVVVYPDDDDDDDVLDGGGRGRLEVVGSCSC